MTQHHLDLFALLPSALAQAVIATLATDELTGAFVGDDLKDAAEASCVETGLESLLILAEMDRQKRDAATERWRPSLWQHM